MGCGGSYVQRQPDVLVQGTGVEPLHCYIENVDGVVTLYPLGEMTSVDGLPVVTPVRLTQGICIFDSSSITREEIPFPIFGLSCASIRMMLSALFSIFFLIIFTLPRCI